MKIKSLFMFTVCSLIACANDSGEPINAFNPDIESAVITEITIDGSPGSYTFWVTIQSPDTGCKQYADWWEVVKPDGSLVYRRILTHSHVTEQPFTRSGGPIGISADEPIIVRAHMNSVGYGAQVYSGSVGASLVPETLSSPFAEQLEIEAPLPQGCAF